MEALWPGVYPLGYGGHGGRASLPTFGSALNYNRHECLRIFDSIDPGVHFIRGGGQKNGVLQISPLRG